MSGYLVQSLFILRRAASPTGSHMHSVSVDTFRANLREHVEKSIADHQPLKVTVSDGTDFVVIGVEDWEREQETLYVLQSPSLMAQIARSTTTHAASAGYRPPQDQLAEEIGESDRF